MTRPKGRPKTSERDDKTVKVDRRLANMAASVAEFRGKTLAEFLSDLLEGPVTAEYGRMIRETDPARKKGGE